MSPSDRKKQAEALIAPYVNRHAPGGAITVLEFGASVWTKHFGLADMDTHTPNTPGTKHALASVSKMFTAALVLRLVDAGRLNMEAPVSAYLPGYKVLDGITLKHLLGMTSGLPDHFDLMFACGGMRDHDYNAADHLGLLAHVSERFSAPDERFLYANMNYLLLARIIEGVTGKTFDNALKELVLEPAGIKETLCIDGRLIPHEAIAKPYVYNGEESEHRWLNGRQRNPAIGLGNLYAPVSDLVKWHEVLASGKLGDGLVQTDLAPLFSEHFLADETPTGYGYGMMVRKYRGARMYGHLGGWQGYRSVFLMLPELEMAVIFCANRTDLPIEKIAYGLIDIFAAERLQSPPLDEQAETALQIAKMPLQAMPKLNGTYLNGESGDIFRLDWQAPHLVVQTGAHSYKLSCTQHGYFTNRFGIMPVQLKPGRDPDKNAIRIDFINGGYKQSFYRSDTFPPPKTVLTDYLGSYLNEALDARISIRERNGQLLVRIGDLKNEGHLYTATALALDIYCITDIQADATATYTLKFTREPNSQLIRSVSLTTDRLKSFTYRKLRSY